VKRFAVLVLDGNKVDTSAPLELAAERREAPQEFCTYPVLARIFTFLPGTSTRMR
jgi:hypothetical protein